VEHVVQFDDKRGTLPGLDMSGIRPKGWSARKGTRTQVLHGCRQLVS